MVLFGTFELSQGRSLSDEAFYCVFAMFLSAILQSLIDDGGRNVKTSVHPPHHHSTTPRRQIENQAEAITAETTSTTTSPLKVNKNPDLKASNHQAELHVLHVSNK